MTFNYAEEKRKFESQWEKTSRFYAEQGMSPESIAIMREYDWNWFKAQRIEAMHTQELAAPNFSDGEKSECAENLILERFLDRFSTGYDPYGTHSRFWWLEELASPRLTAIIPILTKEDKELLTLLFVEGFTITEIAKMCRTYKMDTSRTVQRLFERIRKAGSSG